MVEGYYFISSASNILCHVCLKCQVSTIFILILTIIVISSLYYLPKTIKHPENEKPVPSLSFNLS